VTFGRKIRYRADPRSFWEARGGTAEFEKYPDEVLAQHHQFFRQQLTPLGAQSALEVGCGYGRMLEVTRSCLRPPARSIGVDFGGPQLRRAYSRLHPPTLFAQGNAAALPLRSGTVDLAYTVGVLMHLTPEAVPRALDELIRVSRRWVVISESFETDFHLVGVDFAQQLEARGLVCRARVENPYPVVRRKSVVFAVFEKAGVGAGGGSH
jgi:ubiquinone/menaquinone biosynthesis C-methylase UbiE